MTKTMKNLVLAGATAAAIALSPAAFAGETSQSFNVERTTNPAVRVAVKAFKKGDYERSVRLNQQALRKGLSSSRASVAQSNICASYAMLGELEKAGEACQAALDLKPDNDVASANKAALTVRMAQITNQSGN